MLLIIEALTSPPRCLVPELPEVETVVRELRSCLVGRRIASVKVGKQRLRRRWSRKWEPHLIGRRVGDVRRRGKWIVLILEGEFQLVIHLGMTGQLVVVPARDPLAPHTHAVFDLDRGGRQLRFRDVRRFGSATLFTQAARVDRFFQQAGLGPEPFELEPAYWRRRLAATRRCSKAVLLDQRVVAGLGNIYADEALFQARLSPRRRACDLTSAESTRLRRAIVTVLNRAIDKRGSSIRNYVGGLGLRGEYQNEFRVYQRTGKPCLRCRTQIRCIRLAGRSTHFCPQCQKESPV
jgi:formamidopyrimidine-DNA glycosylase